MRNDVAEVARLIPLPIGKYGASHCKKAQVLTRPPRWAQNALMPIAALRAVSEITFAET